MEFVKKNKWLVICLSVFAVVMLFALVGMKDLLMPNSSKNLYGNRLDGIDKVAISESVTNKVKEDILATKKAVEVTYDLRGKLINFIITVDNATDKVSAMGLADKVLSNFSDEEKKFYDFQVFLKTNEESEIYPIIGYKHTTSLNFAWSNN